MISRGKADRQAARSKRLSAALRENLKRRKAQARSRASGGAERDTANEAAAPRPTRNTPDFRRNRGSD
jgi:hypothetical protein